MTLKKCFKNCILIEVSAFMDVWSRPNSSLISPHHMHTGLKHTPQNLTRTQGDKVWRFWVERFNIELKDSLEQQNWTIDHDYIIYISIDMQVVELPHFMDWKCAWHPVFDCFKSRHNQFTVGATNYTRSGVGAHRLSFILTTFMKYVPKATFL